MLWNYTSNPATEPVTYIDAKAQLRLDDDTEQTLVTGLITTARLYAERVTSRTLVSRNVTCTYYGHEMQRHQTSPQLGYVAFGGGVRLMLPRGPVQTITNATDANSNPITGYVLERVGSNDYVRFPNTAPLFPVTVNYVAGFGDATQVPQDLKTGILMHVGQLWRYRESATERQQYDVAHGLGCIYGGYAAGEVAG